ATSDLHGWFVPWDFALDKGSKAGSLTYLATQFKQERANHKNVVLVDCGDAVQANYVEFFIDHAKNPMVDAMNYLQYDAWTWGNHEYNFSQAQRDALVKQSKAPALSGNVYFTETGKRYLPATTVVERDGVKIGIIGLTTPLITEFEKGEGTLDNMTVHNPMDETALAIKDLQAQKVDAIVGVFHMGLKQENDVKGSSVTELAKAYPALDVIVAGHAHKEVAEEIVNGVLITEPKNYARVYSSVDLTFVPEGGGYKLVDKHSEIHKAGTTEDAGLVALMEPYKKELSAYVNTPIGALTGKDLSGTDKIKGIAASYTETTGIWNLMFAASMYYSKAQAVILNSDYEDIGFPVGKVSIKDISSSYSYSSGEITTYKVTGAELKTLLEFSAAYFNQIKPGDLTVSYNPDRRQSKYSTNNIGGGITYTLDLTQPAGSRVKDLCLITDYRADRTTVLDQAGKPKTTPITDSTQVLLGANSYSMNQWLGKGGCLEGKKLEIVDCTSDKWGDDGSVRALTIRYITEVLKGKIDGNAFDFDSWSLHTGIDTNSAVYKQAVELINSGKISLPALENGRTNVKSITAADVAAAQ
ncbi:MAG: 5'-nucleotidase C-terminal domain-containing protein, partial [Pseudoflavonifractor sp.]